MSLPLLAVSPNTSLLLLRALAVGPLAPGVALTGVLPRSRGLLSTCVTQCWPVSSLCTMRTSSPLLTVRCRGVTGRGVMGRCPLVEEAEEELELVLLACGGPVLAVLDVLDVRLAAIAFWRVNELERPVIGVPGRLDGLDSLLFVVLRDLRAVLGVRGCPGWRGVMECLVAGLCLGVVEPP